MPPRYSRPVTPAERQRREQADADKVTALHTRLAEQVAALRSGADWRAWLQVARRFHAYSFHNILLIGAQRPDATTVAGYRAWQALGRQVDKGERGIGILAPVIRRPRQDRGSSDPQHPDDKAKPAEAGAGEPDGRPGRLAGFRVAYVWDVSQTSGRPLPEQPRPQLLAGDAPPGLWESLTGLVAGRGFTVERGDCGQANGITDFTRRTVRVRGDVDDAQAVKTLAHEAGHVLLHDPTDRGGPTAVTTAGLCRGTVEVEAESLAYLVAAAHGLATDDYTFPYVTGWAAGITGTPPEQAVRDTAGRVLGAARTVLAVTAPHTAPTIDGTLAARVQAGARRTAAALVQADTAYALSAAQATPGAPAVEVGVEVLVRLHADAAAFYTAQLAADTPNAARARAMLTERAVPAAAVAAYQVGYAPPGWTALTDHLHGLGYTDPHLLAAGVGLASRRGTVLDRFRDRIMFPVHDPTGEVVAFLGRALDPAADTPKYLNSPQTALYSKGEVLYGLGAPPTRQALAAGARPVIVEGALDAIAVTTAGDGRHVGVAPSGTALTAGQVTTLAHAAGALAGRGVTVAFDSDPAGRQAALRAYPLLRAAGAWPTTADLPDGHDPASLTQQHGTAALTAALETGRPLAEQVVEERLAGWAGRLDWPEGRIGAARDTARIIAALPPEHVGPQVARLADRLGLDPATITAAVLDALTGPDTDTGPDEHPPLQAARDQPPGIRPSPARLAAAGYPRQPALSVAATSATGPVGVHRPAPVRSRACHPG